MPSRSASIAPSGSRRPVGLLGLQTQTSVARAGRRRAPPGRPSPSRRSRRQARHGDHSAAALLGVDAVHRRRSGSRSTAASPAGRNALVHMSRISSAPAPGHDLVERDAVACRGGLDAAAGSRPAGTRRGVVSNRPAARSSGEQRRRGGRRVEVEPEHLRRPGCRTARRRPRRSPPSCTRRDRSATSRANGLGLIGRPPGRRVGVVARRRSAPRRRRGGRAGPRPRPGCGSRAAAPRAPRA